MRLILILVLFLCSESSIYGASTTSAASSTSATSAQTKTDKKPAPEDNRIPIDATINGQAVRLILDTGSEQTFLFRRAAERLKLKVTEPDPDARTVPGKFLPGLTEPCRFVIGEQTVEERFNVVDLPANTRPVPFDGVVGWTAARENLLHFQVGESRVTKMKALPEDIDTWTKYELWKGEQNVLAFKVPVPGGAGLTIIIDTGSQDGVKFDGNRWNQWRSAHADKPATLEGTIALVGGERVEEMCWADKVTIGNFTVPDVPVTHSHLLDMRAFESFQATIGFFAMTRLEIITDWNGGNVYMRPTRPPSTPYAYNRLGAVFSHGGINGTECVARVAKDSPAVKAGIQDGDILLKVDDLDVARWRTDPFVPRQYEIWSRPAGTKLHLSLQREGKPFDVTVELQDIVGPKVEKQ
jgi:hypothetical protein